MFTGLVRFVRLKYFSFFFFLVLKSLLKRVKLISKIENPRKRHEADTVHISGL